MHRAHLLNSSTDPSATHSLSAESRKIARPTKMRIVAICGTGAILNLFLGSTYASTFARDTTASCQEQIAIAGTKLSDDYRVKITDVQVTNVDDWRNSPFNKTNKQIWFLFEDNAKSRDLMASSMIQLGIASQVLDQCNHIDIVGFGMRNSGYLINHFRMPSGKHQIQVTLPCSRDSMNADMPWGYNKTC